MPRNARFPGFYYCMGKFILYNKTLRGCTRKRIGIYAEETRWLCRIRMRAANFLPGDTGRIKKKKLIWKDKAFNRRKEK